MPWMFPVFLIKLAAILVYWAAADMFVSLWINVNSLSIRKWTDDFSHSLQNYVVCYIESYWVNKLINIYCNILRGLFSTLKNREFISQFYKFIEQNFAFVELPFKNTGNSVLRNVFTIFKRIKNLWGYLEINIHSIYAQFLDM